MFEVEYNGANSVTLSTKSAKIITDPKISVAGLKDKAIKENVQLATEARFMVEAPDARISIEGPGEFGVADFDIRGIAAQRHLDTESDPKATTMYRIETPEVRVALLGNVYEKLNDEQIEELGVIDILIIPVGGGGYTLDATAAAGLTRKIDPKVVIPVHYAESGVKYEVPQDGIDAFVKELGVPTEDGGAKYKLKSASALPQTLTVVTLTRG